MIKVGILGTGNIGTDLLLKILREDFMNITIFSGRRMDSQGIQIAIKNHVPVTDTGIEYFIKNPNCCDVVFDCTNAKDARSNAQIFSKQGIKVIDMTPAKVGEMCVPSINPEAIKIYDNVNMITCGGQASLPLLNLISDYCDELEYVEVVSQISSDSAGMATRINIDNYIHTTEMAIEKFTKTKKSKVILNLNPAEPCVDMQTTMFVKYNEINFEGLIKKMYSKIDSLREYIPYYQLIIPPTISDNVLVLSVRVRGMGDYLPEYAGNLDIINCAAIELVRNLT